MEYYRMMEETGYRNVIYPRFPTVSQIWGEDKPAFIQGKIEKPNQDMEFLSFYQATILSGAFLVSKKAGDIWKEYQLGGRYRPCVLGSTEKKIVETYYFMYPRLLPVLHKDTRYFANGEIETIILSKETVQVHKVFGVKGKHTTYLIVAGDVLDRMMQEGITGFLVDQVDLREGLPWQKTM